MQTTEGIEGKVQSAPSAPRPTFGERVANKLRLAAMGVGILSSTAVPTSIHAETPSDATSPTVDAAALNIPLPHKAFVPGLSVGGSEVSASPEQLQPPLSFLKEGKGIANPEAGTKLRGFVYGEPNDRQSQAFKLQAEEILGKEGAAKVPTLKAGETGFIVSWGNSQGSLRYSGIKEVEGEKVVEIEFSNDPSKRTDPTKEWANFVLGIAEENVKVSLIDPNTREPLMSFPAPEPAPSQK